MCPLFRLENMKCGSDLRKVCCDMNAYSNMYLFMINVIKLKSKTFFICFIVLVAFSSCNVSSSSTEDIELTPEKAIGKLADISPTEGAQFFVDNRAQYSFLDH